MILKVETSFKLLNVTRAVGLYMGLEKLPEYISLTGPYFKMGEDKQLRTLAFYRVDPKKREEALTFLAERYATFEDLPEFDFFIEEWGEYQDTLKRFGVL